MSGLYDAATSDALLAIAANSTVAGVRLNPEQCKQFSRFGTLPDGAEINAKISLSLYKRNDIPALQPLISARKEAAKLAAEARKEAVKLAAEAKRIKQRKGLGGHYIQPGMLKRFTQ